MSGRTARSSSDLRATVGWALLGAIVALAPVGTVVSSLALLPMVFVVPGYALAAALFLPGTIPAAERTVYTVVLSVAATALSGVAVQLVLPLGEAVWVVTLLLVTVAASAVALVRRGPVARSQRPRPRLPRIGAGPASTLIVAMVLAIWAISISSEGAREERDEVQFTELWVLPQEPEETGGDEGEVEIGVVNHEGARAAFEVQVTLGRAVLDEWRVPLADDGRWEATLPAPTVSAEEPLRVTLFKDGAVHRRAFLRSGVS